LSKKRRGKPMFLSHEGKRKQATRLGLADVVAGKRRGGEGVVRRLLAIEEGKKEREMVRTQDRARRYPPESGKGKEKESVFRRFQKGKKERDVLRAIKPVTPKRSPREEKKKGEKS